MIYFRPHHFMCALGFSGKGYSRAFIKNLKAITDTLRHDLDGLHTKIQVVCGHDDVCKHCPNKTSTGCTHDDKITQLDANHSTILKLKYGEIISWEAAKQRIRDNMSTDVFEAACACCYWKQFGICKAALELLIQK